jgi:hypothetical protein
MNALGRNFFRACISLLGLAFGGEMLIAQGTDQVHPSDPAEQPDSLLLQVDQSLAQEREAAPERGLQLGQTVSAADLRLPAAVAKELRLSLQRYHSGDLRDSAKHLEKAILIEDMIPVAHYNLGICYLGLEEYEKALRISKGIGAGLEIDSGSPRSVRDFVHIETV